MCAWLDNVQYVHLVLQYYCEIKLNPVLLSSFSSDLLEMYQIHV